MDSQVLPGLLAAICFGAMAFFSFLYAPLVFAKLPGHHAAALIRAVFPWYFSTLGAVTAIASIIAVYVGAAGTIALAVVCLGFWCPGYGSCPRSTVRVIKNFSGTNLRRAYSSVCTS